MRIKDNMTVGEAIQAIDELIVVADKKLDLAKKLESRTGHCIIWNMFTDSNNPIWERNQYCEKNCGFKCLNSDQYKRTLQK